MAVRTPSKASPASRTARLSPKKSSTAVQRYLVLYNLVSAVIWGYCLFSLGLHLSSSKSLDDLVANAASGHSVFGETVKYVQTVALLELVHVVFGLVRSSLVTTGMQIASRITMVWYICNNYPQVAASPYYSSMVFAWSFTEVVRYSHYAAGLLDLKINALEWLRYSTFYLLYPLGAGSEAALIWASAQPAGSLYGPIGMYATKALVLVWPPALLVMMSHMHAQRTKHVRGVKKGGKKSEVTRVVTKGAEDTPSRGTRSKSKAM